MAYLGGMIDDLSPIEPMPCYPIRENTPCRLKLVFLIVIHAVVPVNCTRDALKAGSSTTVGAVIGFILPSGPKPTGR